MIGHRSWLEREDFVGEFAETFESTTGHSPMTVLDWSAALGAVESGRVLCSSSESQMLRIAASIAEGIPVDLRGTLCGLDSTNSVLVAQALLHAAGHQRCGFAISEQR